MRQYADGGRPLDGQLGGEPTPAEYIEALLACTREWMRVLKPGGSAFVNLGDKYSNYFGPNWGHGRNPGGGERGQSRVPVAGPVSAPELYGVPAKSLLGLPWRYANACVDQLGLILRRDIIWHKANGLPESVTDRCRSSHEYLFHLVRQPRYYSAVDEIREQHTMRPQRRPNGHRSRQQLGVLPAQTYSTSRRDDLGVDGHPLGKLPGSVWIWDIPSQPLVTPKCRLVWDGRTEQWFPTWAAGEAHLRGLAGDRRAWRAHRGRPSLRPEADHFAAFPMELPRRVIQGWSPAGICTGCGQGRFPVTAYTGESGRRPGGGGTYRAMKAPGAKDTNLADGALRYREIAGYACACTPYTDHPDRRRPSVTPTRSMGRGHQSNQARAEANGNRHHGDDWPDRQPVREWHFDQWTPAPTRPAVVLDPFGGTGTTATVADALGRTGVTVDRSSDYCRLSRWRTTDPGERARAMQVPKPPPPPADMDTLFDLGVGA